jgi:CheY-like chemotaxis protein
LAISLHFPKGMARSGFYSTDSLSGIYVLVVDSEQERRALISGILRYCGALVTPTTTSETALAIMALFRPDVVIVHVSSPDDGSLAFIRSVRALKPEDGGMVPVIAVDDGNANAERAHGRGFDAYVSTPLEASELCRVITRLLTV